MKKVFAFISILAVACAALFAEVTAKKNADGSYEATFFYGNPRASEVLLAGSFTNWQNGALPMEKGDKGFSLTVKLPAETENVSYKFISDGNWTSDLKAPMFVDDGFGGKNGYAEMAELCGGSDDDSAGKAKLLFSTWSNLAFQERWYIGKADKNEENKDAKGSSKGDVIDAGLNLKSYVKIKGTALPNTPIYLEVAVAEQDGLNNLYKSPTLTGSGLDLDDGVKKAFCDVWTNPVCWLNQGYTSTSTYLGQFKWGFNNKFVTWETGWRNAKLPAHKIGDWTTVDGEWEAGYSTGGGYNAIETGSYFLEAFPVSIKAGIIPNRAADRAGNKYGFIDYVTVGAGDHTFDFQNNIAFADTYSTWYDTIYETDYIVGYSGKFNNVKVMATGSYSAFGETLNKAAGTRVQYAPGSSDVGKTDAHAQFIHGTAAKIKATYGADNFSVTAGYRYRGLQANQMYVEDGNSDDHYHLSDQLGFVNRQAWFADVSVTPVAGLTVGIAPTVETLFDKSKLENIQKTSMANGTAFNNRDNVKTTVASTITADLNEFLDMPSKVTAYARVIGNTCADDQITRGKGNDDDKHYTLLESAGIKYEQDMNSDLFKGFEVSYGYDNRDTDVLWNNVIGQLNFKKDAAVQAAFGVRTTQPGKDSENIENPFGFAVGAWKKLPNFGKPKAFAQFMYAMDPFNSLGDCSANYKLNGDNPCILDRKASDKGSFYNVAAVRVGLSWDI